MAPYVSLSTVQKEVLWIWLVSTAVFYIFRSACITTCILRTFIFLLTGFTWTVVLGLVDKFKLLV